MSAVRLSPLRNKGWLRFTMVGTALTLPAAALEHSLGYFSDGTQGLAQASEFVGAGIAIVLIVGLSAAWVLNGFAVKQQREEEDGEESHSSPSRGGAPAHPQPHRPAPGQKR